MVRHGVRVIVDLHQEAAFFKRSHHGFPAGVSVHPGKVAPGVLGHRTVQTNHLDLGKRLTPPDLVVVRVVRGRHLHRPAPHLRIGRLIRHDRNLSPDQGQRHVLADGVLEALVVRVNGHTRITQHRFRPRCCHDHVGPSVYARIPDVPQVTILLDLVHLEVRDHRLALGTPVHDPAAPIDPPLLVEPHKRLDHRPVIPFVHREPGPGPVIAASELFQLLEDSVAILLAPFPDPLQHFFTGNVVSRLPGLRV